MNSNFFRHTFRNLKKSSFTSKSYFSTMNSQVNSSKIKINYMNLFYNQRICFLNKCTTLVNLFKTPAILSASATCIDELENEECVVNSMLKLDGICLFKIL